MSEIDLSISSNKATGNVLSPSLIDNIFTQIAALVVDMLLSCAVKSVKKP